MKIYTVIVETCSNSEYWYNGHEGREFEVVLVPNIDQDFWPGTDVVYKTRIPVAVLHGNHKTPKEKKLLNGFLLPGDCKILNERKEVVGVFSDN